MRILFYFKGMIFLYIIREKRSGGENEFLITISLLIKILYCIKGVLRILFYFKGMIFLYIIRENGKDGNEFLITISLLIKILYCIEDFILFYF